jgi:hypothetical protein
MTELNTDPEPERSGSLHAYIRQMLEVFRLFISFLLS